VTYKIIARIYPATFHEEPTTMTFRNRAELQTWLTANGYTRKSSVYAEWTRPPIVDGWSHNGFVNTFQVPA
jgi:hypothetical protein